MKDTDILILCLVANYSHDIYVNLLMTSDNNKLARVHKVEFPSAIRM